MTLFATRTLFPAAALLLAAQLSAPAALAQTTTTPAAPAQPAPAVITAPGTGPLVLGVLDVEEMLLNSTAGKSITAQANARAKALGDDSQKKEDALVAQLKQLDAQRQANPAMPDYDAKRKALVAQDDQLRANFDKNRQAIDQAVDRARQVLYAAGKKAMNDVAKAKGMTLVLNRNAVNLFPDGTDITDEVMQRLNKTLPNVKLP